MSNFINIENLRRNKIRKTIDVGGEFDIEIYNPSPDEKKEILKTITTMIDPKTGKPKFSISGSDFMVILLPMLTNIKLDGLSNDVIMEVLEDPSDELLQVKDCVDEIVKEIVERATKNFKDISSLPDEIIEEIFKNEQENKLTDEEIKAIEKAKKLGLV